MKLDILKESIKKRGFRLDFIAKQLNGKSEFKWSEVEKIIEVLKLDEIEKKKIFFN